jgi:hypothetical protein
MKPNLNSAHRKHNSQTRQIKRRPFGVTVLTGLVLTLAVINLVRMTQAVLLWEFLKDLLPFTPLYLVLNGSFWGLTGLIVAVLVWSGWKKTPQLTLAYFGLFSLLLWLDRLFMPGYPGRNSNWPFVIGINIILFAWSVWFLLKSKARKYFEAANE